MIFLSKEQQSRLYDVYCYFIGKYRYKLFYSKYGRYLIRKHIFEQITYRIYVMDRECYERGSCKMCGCDTTALQMAPKACDKPCYPKMVSKRKWNKSNERRVYQILESK